MKMVWRSRKIFKFILCSAVLIILILILILNSKNGEYRDDFIIANTVNELENIDHDRLVNLLNFKYLLSNYMCSRFEKKLLGIILVTSYVGHDQLRSSHRQAISQAKLMEMGLLRVFLLAAIPSQERFITQKQITDEQLKFGDLIQGNFNEAYRNLTYKHTMGLKWAAMECSNAKFIVKIDDDTVFDIFHLKRYLNSIAIDDKIPDEFIAGYLLDHNIPIRVSANKWFVSRDEYLADLYPDYLSGWLYITKPNVAAKLVIESQSEKFFWIDDTYITGILRNKLQIPLVKLNSWFSANSEFLDCCVRDLKEFKYECDYYVGPNGGDSKLIVKFIREVEKCNTTKKCIKRSPEKTLKQTCVAEKKNLLLDHGDALVRAVRI